MNKLYLILLAVLMLSVLSVNAAVTGCINSSDEPATSVGAYPKYNDTGTITNVTAGLMCYNATNYSVVPGFMGYDCAIGKSCVIGACYEGSYYLGFDGTGTNGCSWTGAILITPTAFQVPEDYRIRVTENTTGVANDIAYGDYCNITNATGTPSWTNCLSLAVINGTTGYCDGSGYKKAGTMTVTTGRVCLGTNYSTLPNATYNCGTWYACTANVKTAPSYYVGYDGPASCTATGWVSTGSTSTFTYISSVTRNASTCECTSATCKINLAGLPHMGSNIGGFMTALAPGIGVFIVLMTIFVAVGGLLYAMIGFIKDKINKD